MTKQIKSFGMAKMTIGSCADFHHQVMKHIEAATPAALHISDKMTAYEAAIATLDSIVNRQRAFVTTKTLADADDVRDRAVSVIISAARIFRKCDRAVSVIISAARIFRKSPVAEQSEAAELLHPQFSAYKDITRHEYSKQTAEVRGLLAVLDQSENKAAASTLGLSGVVDALREANATFEESTKARTEEISGRMAQSDVNSADALDAANELYKAIVLTVNAYAVVQPSDEINAFVDALNGTVEYYSRIAGGKPSGSGSASGGGQGSDDEDEEGGGGQGGGSLPEGEDGGL